MYQRHIESIHLGNIRVKQVCDLAASEEARLILVTQFLLNVLQPLPPFFYEALLIVKSLCRLFVQILIVKAMGVVVGEKWAAGHI